MRLSHAMNILLRLTIIVIAGFAIWQFSDAFSLAMETLAKPREALWFNVLSALAEGVLGRGLRSRRSRSPPPTSACCSQRLSHAFLIGIAIYASERRARPVRAHCVGRRSPPKVGICVQVLER